MLVLKMLRKAKHWIDPKGKVHALHPSQEHGDGLSYLDNAPGWAEALGEGWVRAEHGRGPVRSLMVEVGDDHTQARQRAAEYLRGRWQKGTTIFVDRTTTHIDRHNITVSSRRHDTLASALKHLAEPPAAMEKSLKHWVKPDGSTHDVDEDHLRELDDADPEGTTKGRYGRSYEQARKIGWVRGEVEPDNVNVELSGVDARARKNAAAYIRQHWRKGMTVTMDMADANGDLQYWKRHDKPATAYADLAQDLPMQKSQGTPVRPPVGAMIRHKKSGKTYVVVEHLTLNPDAAPGESQYTGPPSIGMYGLRGEKRYGPWRSTQRFAEYEVVPGWRMKRAANGYVVIAFDLDGTLAEYDGDASRIGPPIPGMREVVQALVDQHDKPVAVLTARTDLQAVHTWLQTHGFPDMPVTNRKDPSFSTIVDDRALNFTSAMVNTPGKQRKFLDLVLRYEPYWSQVGKSLRIMAKATSRPGRFSGPDTGDRTYLYHVSRPRHMDTIKTSGLQPQRQGKLSGPRLFFTRDKTDQTWHYPGWLVVLRTPAKGVRVREDRWGSPDSPTAVYTTQPIPSERVEFYHPKRKTWHPVREWAEDEAFYSTDPVVLKSLHVVAKSARHTFSAFIHPDGHLMDIGDDQHALVAVQHVAPGTQRYKGDANAALAQMLKEGYVRVRHDRTTIGETRPAVLMHANEGSKVGLTNMRAHLAKYAGASRYYLDLGNSTIATTDHAQALGDLDAYIARRFKPFGKSTRTLYHGTHARSAARLLRTAGKRVKKSLGLFLKARTGADYVYRTGAVEGGGETGWITPDGQKHSATLDPNTKRDAVVSHASLLEDIMGEEAPERPIDEGWVRYSTGPREMRMEFHPQAAKHAIRHLRDAWAGHRIVLDLVRPGRPVGAYYDSGVEDDPDAQRSAIRWIREQTRVKKSFGFFLKARVKVRPPQVIPDDIKAMKFYHATSDEPAGQAILTSGMVQPPKMEKQSRAYQAPVMGHVYASPSLENAAVYSLGGVVAGTEYAGTMGFGSKHRYGYVFEVQGKDMTRVRPDEDVVGEMFYHAQGGATRYEHQYGNFGTQAMHGKEIPYSITSAKNLIRGHRDERAPEAAIWAKWGKRLVNRMSDDEKFEIIRMGAHIAHEGALPITRAWRVDKKRVGPKIKPDGSNLLDLAEEIPVPTRKSLGVFLKARRPFNAMSPRLAGARAHAAHYERFEDFNHDWGTKNIHGNYWHLTDTPDFAIDPQQAPRDASTMAAGPETKRWNGKAYVNAGTPGLMVTTDIDNWSGTLGASRKHVAEIDLSDLVPQKEFRDTTRGFGQETWVDVPAKAKVRRVLTLQQARRVSARDYSTAYPKNEDDLRAVWTAGHVKKSGVFLKSATTTSHDLPSDVQVHPSETTIHAVLNGDSPWRLRTTGTRDQSVRWGTTYDTAIEPKDLGGLKAVSDRMWIDPDLVDHLEPQGEGLSPHVVPRKNAGSDRVPATPNASTLFRGMSAPEFRTFKQTGHLQSDGSFNLPGQEGLTLFTPDPHTAEGYASGFAPWHRVPTRSHPAYVVAIKHPGQARIGPNPFHNDNEVAVKGGVSWQDVSAVYEGRPYRLQAGHLELVPKGVKGGVLHTEGSRMSPSASVLWRQVEATQKSFGLFLKSAEYDQAPEGWRRFIIDAKGSMYGERPDEYIHADLVAHHFKPKTAPADPDAGVQDFQNTGGVLGHVGHEYGRHVMAVSTGVGSALGRWNAAHAIRKLAREGTHVTVDLLHNDGRVAHSMVGSKHQALQALFEHGRSPAPQLHEVTA